MPRFYETTLSITNLHNLSISTHVNRSRIYYRVVLGIRAIQYWQDNQCDKYQYAVFHIL